MSAARSGHSTNEPQGQSDFHAHRSWSVVWAGLAFAAFFTLVFLVHRKGFNAPLIYDSLRLLADNEYVFEQGDFIQAVGIVPRRPLTMATFYLNYLLTGMEPAFFRLTNAVILAATGLMVVFVTARVLACGRSRGAPDPVDRAVGLIAGLLFVLHPLQTYVVLYAWQREALLACFFYYGALLSYLAVRGGSFALPAFGYVLTALLFFGALLSKENTVTLPAVLLLAELTLFRASIRHAVRRSAVIAAVTGPVFALYVIVTNLLHAHGSLTTKGILDQLQSHFATSGITPWEMLLTESRVLFSYLATIIAPLPGHVLFFKAELVSRSLTQPPVTLVACLGVVGLVVMGVALARRASVVAFGILFFCTALIPESVLIPQYLFLGYRAILPMVGVLLIGAWCVRQVLVRAETHRAPLKRLVWAATTVVAAYLAVITYSQAARWNPIHFWEEAYAALPPISRDVERVSLLDVLGNYGEALVDSGDYTRAATVLEPAVRALGPRSEGGGHAERSSAPAGRTITEKTEGLMILLGKSYRMSGRVSDAVALFQRQLERSPGSAALHNSLGLALAESGSVADAIASYQKAIAINPGLAEAYNNLGAAYRDTGRSEEAAAQFRRALEADPRFPLAHLNLALTLMDGGNLREALRNCLRAVELDPRSSTAHGVLGRVLEATGKTHLAVQSYRTAARLDPKFPDAYQVLGDALSRSAAYDEASASYRQALTLKPQSVEARANLGFALVKAGKAAEATAMLREALDAGIDHPDLHNVLGIAFAAQGDVASAVTHFEYALKLAPDHPGAKSNLERTLERQREGIPQPDRRKESGR